MPALKRIFSTLVLRPKPADSDEYEDEPLPKVRKHSLLKRSNAVLRKKVHAPFLGHEITGEPYLHGADEPDDWIDNGRQQQDRPAPRDFAGRFHGLQEFHNEMQAIADMRSVRRRPVFRANGDNNDADSPTVDFGARLRPQAQHAPASRKNAIAGIDRSSYRHLIAFAANKKNYLDDGPHSSRHRELPLAHARAASCQDSSGVSRDVFRRRSFEGSDQRLTVSSDLDDSRVPLRFQLKTSNGTLVAGKQKGKGNAIAAKSNRPCPAQLAVVEDHPLSSTSSPKDSMFIMARSHLADMLPQGRKTSRQSNNRDQSQGLVEDRLSAQQRLRHGIFPSKEHFSDAPEYPQAAEEDDVDIMAIKAEQLALTLAAGRLSDEQLDKIMRDARPTSLQHRDCIVCGDTKLVLDFPAKPPTTTCTHNPQTCTICLETWLASEISTKGTTAIKCSECPATLFYADIQRFAAPDSFATYDNLTIRAALGDLPDFSWCLSPTCNSGQENPEAANYMDCHACGYKQCLSHRVPWHTDETCAEYSYRISGRKAQDDAENERKTQAILDSVSKKCPNPDGCGWRIQKIDGCDHMTCRKCRWEFCFLCGASQREIRRVGNTAHEAMCKYHSRNLEVAWPFNVH